MLDQILLNILMLSLRRWLIRIILPINLNLSLNFTNFIFVNKKFISGIKLNFLACIFIIKEPLL